MGYRAKYGHLEVVFSARECGISFRFMLVHAKNLNAMFRAAGLFLIVVHMIKNFILEQAKEQFFFGSDSEYSYMLNIMQRFEGAF